MKKLIALLLSLVMIFALAACGGSESAVSESAVSAGSAAEEPDAEAPDAEAPAAEAPAAEAPAVALDGSWPEDPVKIGVTAFDTTDESFMAVLEYFDYLSQYFNVEIIVSETLNAPEDEEAFIKNCASAGCDGIFAYYNIAGAEAMKLATSLGMYYWGTEQYYDELIDDPYYVGTYTFQDANDPNAKNGDYLAGYEIGYSMANSGLEHLVFCNGGAAIGVQMFLDRQEGVLDGIAAAQADGSATRFDPEEDIIEGFPNDAWFAAQAAALAGDYDGVVITFDAFTWFQPIMESGKDIKVGTIGTVSDSYKAFVENGTVTALVYDCPEVVFGSAFIDIVNAATGHEDLTRMEGADGTSIPLRNYVPRWVLSSAEDFNAVYDMHYNGQYYITAEEVATVLGGLNPDATSEDVAALLNLPLETALSK